MCNYTSVNLSQLKLHECLSCVTTEWSAEITYKMSDISRCVTLHLNPSQPWLHEYFQVCDFKTVSEGLLKVHMRTHTDDKPFVCDFCGKQYRTKPLMENHRRLHTGERPFACDYEVPYITYLLLTCFLMN